MFVLERFNLTMISNIYIKSADDVTCVNLNKLPVSDLEIPREIRKNPKFVRTLKTKLFTFNCQFNFDNR